jgi:hypothetical protein
MRAKKAVMYVISTPRAAAENGDPMWAAVRVETMASQKCGIVGKSQSVLIMIDPIIFTRPM